MSDALLYSSGYEWRPPLLNYYDNWVVFWRQSQTWVDRRREIKWEPHTLSQTSLWVDVHGDPVLITCSAINVYVTLMQMLQRVHQSTLITFRAQRDLTAAGPAPAHEHWQRLTGSSGQNLIQDQRLWGKTSSWCKPGYFLCGLAQVLQKWITFPQAYTDLSYVQKPRYNII